MAFRCNNTLQSNTNSQFTIYKGKRFISWSNNKTGHTRGLEIRLQNGCNPSIPRKIPQNRLLSVLTASSFHQCKYLCHYISSTLYYTGCYGLKASKGNNNTTNQVCHFNHWKRGRVWHKNNMSAGTGRHTPQLNCLLSSKVARTCNTHMPNMDTLNKRELRYSRREYIASESQGHSRLLTNLYFYHEPGLSSPFCDYYADCALLNNPLTQQ